MSSSRQTAWTDASALRSESHLRTSRLQTWSHDRYAPVQHAFVKAKPAASPSSVARRKKSKAAKELAKFNTRFG